MRYIIGTMIGFYILINYVFVFLGPILFPRGGVRETHLHPIYSGIILLSGLIVACTKIIIEEIREVKDNNNIEK